MEFDRAGNFKNGYWIWDEVNNSLLFVSRDSGQKATSQTNINAPSTKNVQRHSSNEVRFRETIDSLEQVRFRRYHQRRCRPTETCVIIVQDIKDIALYIANMTDLTSDFIKYFHTQTVDRFLRSLIVYFQYYVQVWDNMQIRREVKKKTLYQPVVTELENVIRDDLADLRTMVGREYCSLLIGAADAKRYHHMNNKNKESQSEKDRRLFETLMCLAVRVVWIALQRKNLNLIEFEMNKLVRTDIFNFIAHRNKRGIEMCPTPSEERILMGPMNTEERKLLHRSLVTKELVNGEHDYRMLLIGIKQFEPTSPRLNYLEAALSAPEENLLELGITLGMLGLPRDDYDAMLTNLTRAAKKKLSVKPRILPPFALPPKRKYSNIEMIKELAAKAPKYKITQQTIRAGKKQRQMWCKIFEKKKKSREMSVIDLSITQSHALLLSPRSSISMANK